MSRDWHPAHVLGSNAPADRRVESPLEHVQVCGRAPVRASFVAEIRARVIDLPERRKGPA